MRILGAEVDSGTKVEAERAARATSDARAVVRLKGNRRQRLLKQASLFIKKTQSSHEFRGGPRVRAPRHCLMVAPHALVRLGWDMGVVAPLMVYLTLMMPFRYDCSQAAELHTARLLSHTLVVS
jgi:hypothetical protein